MTSIQYDVQAYIVDINSYTPKPTDSFFVDTNVWFWFLYNNTMYMDPKPQHYQLNKYPSFINKSLEKKAHIAYCGLSLAELAALIEQSEKTIYNQYKPSVTPKEYRHNWRNERNKVVQKIMETYKQIENIASFTEIMIDGKTEKSILQLLQTAKIDGYDALFLEMMKSIGISQIITDDGDFSTAKGICVFTANRNVIAAAHQQKKLIK